MQLDKVFDPEVLILEKRMVCGIHNLKQLFEELEAACDQDVALWLNKSDITEKKIADMGDVELQTSLLRALCSVHLQISKESVSAGLYGKILSLVFKEKCTDQDIQIRSYLNSINSKHHT